MIMIHYESFKHVLLLGEADFSFARAFAREFSSNDSDKNSIINNNSDSALDNNYINEFKTYNSSISQLCCNSGKILVTATEYGDDDDIAKRYFDGNKTHLADTINYLCSFHCVVEVICKLNARQLGERNERKSLWGGSVPSINIMNQKVEQKKERDLHVCKCQRWDTNLNKWNEETDFWENSNRQNYDLIIFNFPHTDQAGRSTKLVKALFKQLRICIDTGRLRNDVVLEMRLRTIETNPDHKKNIRSPYNHEESAMESGFECIGCWPGDLSRWEKQGYQHRMTKKNETCSDINIDCKVWRWKSLSV